MVTGTATIIMDSIATGAVPGYYSGNGTIYIVCNVAGAYLSISRVHERRTLLKR